MFYTSMGRCCNELLLILVILKIHAYIVEKSQVKIEGFFHSAFYCEYDSQLIFAFCISIWTQFTLIQTNCWIITEK